MERETIKRERGDSSQQQVDEERAHGPHGPSVYGPRYILNNTNLSTKEKKIFSNTALQLNSLPLLNQSKSST